MLHAAAVLMSTMIAMGAIAVIVSLLLNERNAILGALMMKPVAMPKLSPDVRVTRVRYAARLRQRSDRPAVLREAA